MGGRHRLLHILHYLNRKIKIGAVIARLLATCQTAAQLRVAAPKATVSWRLHEILRIQAVVLSPCRQQQTHVLVCVLLCTLAVIRHEGARETNERQRRVRAAVSLSAENQLLNGIVVSPSEVGTLAAHYEKKKKGKQAT